MNNIATKSARRFRMMLIVAFCISGILLAVLSIFGIRFIQSYAATVNEQVAAADATSTQQDTTNSQILQLQRYEGAVERARSIVAESKEYRYQDTIIADIEEFARRAGIEVTNYDFTASSSASSTGSSPSPSGSTTTPPASPASPPTAPQIQPGGSPPSASQQPASSLKSTVATITLTNPVDYRKLLQFLHYIEQNLTKMQVASIRLSGGTDSSKVTTETLQLEVYVR